MKDRFRGIIVLKKNTNYYFVKRLIKSNIPDTYMLLVQNLQKKEESYIEVKAVGFLDAIDSAMSMKKGVLLFDVDLGEWKLWEYEDLTPKLKQLLRKALKIEYKANIKA